MTQPSPSRSGRRWSYLALTFALALSVFLVFALTRSREASPQLARRGGHQPAPAASVASAQQIPPLATPRTPARQPRLVFHPTLTDGAPDGVNEKLSPDSGEVAGEGEREDSETIRQRDDWFFHQRAYPLGFIPSDARLKALNRLDEMIELRNLRDPLSANRDPSSANPENLETLFPGPTVWTLIGPQPVAPLPGAANFGFPTASGRVVALAVDPTNPDIAYAGAAAGGVWRTTNAGATWTPLTDQQPSLATGSNSLALDPSSCAPGPCTILYVGTGEGNFQGDAVYGAGVLKITNPTAATPTIVQLGAATFAGPTGPGRIEGGFFFTGLAVHQFDPNILLAAVRNRNNAAASGIYRSANAGVTWSLVASASGAAGTAIVFNPAPAPLAARNIVYAALGSTGGDADNGVYKSTDAGLTFVRLTGTGANLLPTANLGRIELALAPSAPDTLYVSFASASTGSASLLTPNGTFKTTDAGLNWSPLTATPLYCNPQCFYDFELRVHPTDASHVWAGGGAFTDNSSTLFRTLDGGVSWVNVTGAGPDGVRVHVDTHAFAFNASGTRLYIGNDGGIWKTDTTTAAAGSIDYDGLNATLAITQFYPGHTPHPSDENVHFGGTQDNGTEKYTGSLLWQHVTCGDGAWTAIDPTFPATTYSNCQNIDIRRSFTNGTPGSFTQAITGITGSDRRQFIPPMVHDPFISGRLYFGTCRVWQTTNSASTWTAISPDLSATGSPVGCPSPGGAITAIAVARSDSNYVYVVTTDGKVQRSTNAGSGAAATWTDLTTLDLPGRFATMVAVDPTDKETAYVTYSGFNGFGIPIDTKGHVFKRKVDTPGSFWTDVSGSGMGALPNIPVNDIVIDRFCPGDCTITPDVLIALYIATDVGVFQSTDDGLNWSPLGTGLPKVQVTSLKLRDESRNLTAATHGRSAWKMQLDNLPPPFRFPLPPDFLLLTSISPATAFGGGAAFSMTLDGANFTGSTAVRWEGTSTGISITSQTPNRIVATIPASRIAAGGLAHVTVFDPGATNDQGTGLLFTIINPAPGFTNFAPGGGPAGVATTLLALGSNFVPGVTEVIFRDINLIDRPLATTVTSSTELSAALPGNLIPVPGNYTWRIRNAPPGGGTAPAAAPFNATPAAGIDLVMDKSHTGNFTAGTAASYSMQVGNAGSTPSDSTPISVTDTLPAGLTFVSAPSVNSWTCNFVAPTLTCTNPGPIAAGASSTFALNVNVDAGAPASVTNSATVSGGGDTNPANNTDSDPTTVNAAPTPDMTIAKTHVGNFTVGINGTYTITARNAGSAPTSGTVTVTDTIPVELVALSLTGTGWTCTLATRTCTRADALAAGASYPAITLVAGVNAAAFPSVTNIANVSGGGETNTTNNTANDPTTVTRVDLTIDKSHIGNFTLGVTGTYSIAVSNTGNAASSGTVTVTDTIPVELVALTLTGAGWSCSTPPTLTCTRADALAPSASYPVITLTVNPTATGLVTNTATVSGGNDAVPGNNSDSDPTTVNLAPAPAVTLNPTNVAFGNQKVGTTSATTSVTLSNSGNATLNLTSLTKAGTDPTQFNLILSPTGGFTCTGTNVLTAGQSCTFGVNFAPTTVSAKSANIAVASNAPAASLPLTGTGTVPIATLSTGAVPFGDQRVSTTSAVQSVTLSNTGLAALSLATVALGGTNPTQFAIAAGTTCTNGSTINPGASCLANLTFTPASTGAKSATLTFTDDSNGVAGSTQVVNLTGNGVVPNTGIVPAGPINFSNQPINTTGPATTFTVTNTGGATLNITNVALTGTDLTQFLLTNSGPGSCSPLPRAVAPGANCTFSTAFAPTTTGAKSANATLTDDAGGTPGAQQNIALAGTGVAATVSLSPNPLNFGNQRINTASAAQTETLTNGGTAPLNISAIGNPTGANATDFVKTGGTCAVGTPVPAAGNCTLIYTFTPGATGARGPATVAITNDATGSPHSFSLQGTGTAPVASFSTLNLAFGNQAVGTTSAIQTATLTNTGTDPLNIASIVKAGANAGDFSLGGTCAAGTPVLVAGSCTITSAFTPPATGPFSATITVTDDSNAVAGSTQIINLSGTGIIPPTATLSTNTMAFGNQRVSTTSATQTVTVSNTSTTTPLTITSIAKAGANAADFSLGGTCPAAGGQVPALGSCTVTSAFTPGARGSRVATITLTDDAGNVAGSTQVISLSGTGIAPIASLSTNTMAFGNQRINTTSATQTVTLTNTGDDTLNITSILKAGANTADFSLGGTCPVGASVLAPLANCTITSAFTPSALLARVATITVTDDSNAVAGSTQVVNLSGTGTAPVASLSSNTMAFGNQNVGTTSATQTVTLTNTGTDTLNIASVVKAGANAGEFSLSGTCPAAGGPIAPAASCTVISAFTPTATGARAATITFTDDSNAVAGSTQVINLTGTGTQPAVTLSVASVPFGGVNVGDSKAASPVVTLTNSGTGPLTITGITITGADASHFSQANTCPVSPNTLAAGANCTITPTFRPTATGARTASTQIADNAAGSPHLVALSGTGVDFTVASTTPPQTVVAGTPANYTVNFATIGGPAAGPVTFDCQNLPALATCTFNPATLPAGAGNTPLQLAISTVANAATASRGSGALPLAPAPPTNPFNARLALVLAMMLLGLLLLVMRKKQMRARFAPAFLLVIGVLLATYITGCTSGFPDAQRGTPPGSYTVTVRGTQGPVQHTTTVQLTVQ